jgi:Fe2+ transport system protein FeoA
MAATEGPAYRVDLGQISAANVRDGVLEIDQDATSNIWHGPQGNYGHTLHRNDSYVAMFTLPINVAGGTTLLGRDAFGLEFSVRLRGPHLTGFEKLKIGLMDTEGYKSVAAVSVGRLPLPGHKTSDTTNILDLVSQPAIVLGRVEEPAVRGEILLDYAKIEQPDAMDSLEMVLRVGNEGQLSGLARITSGGQVKELALDPKTRGPQDDAFAARSHVPENMKLAATLFVETLPGLEVNHVYPKEVAVRDLSDADKVRFRIEGFGFGPDSRVEIVPEGTQGAPIPAEAIHRQKVAAPEGTVLLADIGLPAQVGSYGLRVTTGGQSTVFKNAVRVFSRSTPGARTTTP